MGNDLTLSDLPVEVLLDNLLPFVQLPEILRLAATSKFFALLCSDDTLWKRKLQIDFNFSGTGTARTAGWKFVYRGLSKPKVFVWGEKANGRLGLTKFPSSGLTNGVSFPTQVQLPNIRVISLVAGGMSFHALDSEGNVYVWGTLDGSSFASTHEDFSTAGKQARTPLRLQLPAPVTSISCGRLHSMCLDRNNYIWTFVNWGRPFRLSSPLLEDPAARPLQIECGWGFSSLLTKSGQVFVWFPLSEPMESVIERNNREFDADGANNTYATADAMIPCIPWKLEMDPICLPSIPALPTLSAPEDSKAETKVIQIAAFESHIVALTNCGHVLKFGCLGGVDNVSRGRWEYLPKFSEVASVKQHAAFSGPNPECPPPQEMRVTHVSAHFMNFIAYSTGSSSIVLIGSTNTTPESDPQIIPALQHKAVISVALGDYHNVALTESGKLLAWGQYSSGALGLGDPTELEPGAPGGFATQADLERARSRRRGVPPEVEVPAEVRFDYGKQRSTNRFCFAVAAAGWHTGALVIDLDPKVDEDEDEDDNIEREPTPPCQASTFPSTWQSPPIFPGAIFDPLGLRRGGGGVPGRGRGV